MTPNIADILTQSITDYITRSGLLWRILNARISHTASETVSIIFSGDTIPVTNGVFNITGRYLPVGTHVICLSISDGTVFIIGTKDSQNLYTYTPVLTATGATPAFGEGEIRGKYWLDGDRVRGFAEFIIVGSGSAIQGTSWRVTIPIPANPDFHVAGTGAEFGDAIGNFWSRSTTAAQATSGAAILCGQAPNNNEPIAMIFYRQGSNTSVGLGDFTTSARMKINFSYVADRTYL